MDQDRFNELISKYLRGECTPQEEQLLETWYNRFSREQDKTAVGEVDEQVGEDVLTDIIKTRMGRQQERPFSRSPFNYAGYAAAALLLITGAILIHVKPWRIRQSAPTRMPVTAVGHSSARQATLTLADGKTILLDKHSDGINARENTVQYLQGQTVTAAVQEAASSGISPSAYNTLSVPVGATYQVILPDGSHVYLNAQSTLKYPAQFTGDTRLVEMEGEGFFEVSKHDGQPFVVKTKGQEVTVLGTSFNINAYSEIGGVRTTLITGAIEVRSPNQAEVPVRLKPGEAVFWPGETSNPAREKADTETAMAWKQGYFKFDGRLEEAMVQIARWYGVAVSYEQGANRELGIYAKISRKQKLSDVLKYLGEADQRVHIRLKEGRITVMK